LLSLEHDRTESIVDGTLSNEHGTQDSEITDEDTMSAEADEDCCDVAGKSKDIPTA